MTKLFCGIILLTVPSIIYGGYFLLTLLSGSGKLSLTDFQHSMFRAGHAHAGVLVILSLIAELMTEQVNLGSSSAWLVRIGCPLAAILVSGGFFVAASSKGANLPNGMISILYAGIIVLASSLLMLGVGLIRAIR